MDDPAVRQQIVRLLALPLLMVLLSGLIACERGDASAARYIARANANEHAQTTAEELFGRSAPVDDWQPAFQATPDDTYLFEAFAYKQLLRNAPHTTVEASLNRAIDVRWQDPWLYFLRAQQYIGEIRGTPTGMQTAFETKRSVIEDALAASREHGPDNAFYAYQQASFYMILDEQDPALARLTEANAIPKFVHPYGAPLPNEITDLEQLVDEMGTSFGLFFQTTPRTFLTHFNKELKALAIERKGNPGEVGIILEAARRQLEMQPFDLPSFQAALGINKTLWEQVQQAGAEDIATPILERLKAFEEPLAEIANDGDLLAKKLKTSTEHPQLTYGAEMLAITKQFEADTAGDRSALLRQLTTSIGQVSALPAASGAGPNAP